MCEQLSTNCIIRSKVLCEPDVEVQDKVGDQLVMKSVLGIILINIGKNNFY